MHYIKLNQCRLIPPSYYVQTNAGQLPALQTHAWRDHVERKAVPLKGGVNGYGVFTPGYKNANPMFLIPEISKIRFYHLKKMKNRA